MTFIQEFPLEYYAEFMNLFREIPDFQEISVPCVLIQNYWSGMNEKTPNGYSFPDFSLFLNTVVLATSKLQQQIVSIESSENFFVSWEQSLPL